MLDDFPNTTLVDTTKRAMMANFRQHQEVVHNLTNYDTEGFRPRKSDFHSRYLELSEPPSQAFEAYLEDLQPQVDFDIDAEMTRLSQTSMEQEALVKILNAQYSKLRSTIFEGRR
jgi:flagellar basal body rod protein FlgB